MASDPRPPTAVEVEAIRARHKYASEHRRGYLDQAQIDRSTLLLALDAEREARQRAEDRAVLTDPEIESLAQQEAWDDLDVGALLERLRTEVIRRQQVERDLADVLRVLQRRQPDGSPPPGGAARLAEWIVGTLEDRVKATEAACAALTAIGEAARDIDQGVMVADGDLPGEQVCEVDLDDVDRLHAAFVAYDALAQPAGAELLAAVREAAGALEATADLVAAYEAAHRHQSPLPECEAAICRQFVALDRLLAAALPRVAPWAGEAAK